MALTISYFAWVREIMGDDQESVELGPDITTIADLVRWLAARDERGANAFAETDKLRAARDNVMARLDDAIGSAREIALFPPVTGGGL